MTRIDFAIPHPSLSGRFVLAVEADGASYHSSATARDRDRLRQQVLERLGWRVHRIWSTDWFNDPASETEKVLAAYETALEHSGRDVESVEPAEEQRSNPTEVGSQPERPRMYLRQGKRPSFHPGLSINEYQRSTLVALANWIQSDGRLRTESELMDEMMQELGFRRHGSRIVQALEGAIRHARRANQKRDRFQP